MSPLVEHVKDEGTRAQSLISGLTAGLVTRFVISPLDVVKIRLQLQSVDLKPKSGQTVYRGTFSTIRNILVNEGITAFWKGNIPAEVMYATYTGVQFISYRNTAYILQRTVGRENLPHMAESFIAGGVGGASATIVTYPLDLLRTRFAMQGNQRVYLSLFRACRDIHRDEGMRGFFRGLGPTLLQSAPQMGIFFTSYETIRQGLSILKLPWGSDDATAGSLAGAMSKISVFPLDLVRKRMQVQGPTREQYVYSNIPEYRNAAAAFRCIIAKEGIKGLYRGLAISLIKSTPGSTITVWVYGRMMGFLQNMDYHAERLL
ncbi:Mitochondrial thiamine pyrophosphate carrier 1 [Ceratocystis fimbriata CBS 114723]|uniref:Mitochondrial thiamine pyrophosphate carrier 1 n=2 Tax=Ceratocystis TaxID=5157 RepID=A0A2C5WX25_9PEZI|nr:Mitochondrial thiamine pyrophosphate carrier 1 [Ceratocystis fimbriata CBS 114723]